MARRVSSLTLDAVACEAGDDDVDDVHDSVDDGFEDGADAVDDCHDAVAD